MPRQSGPKSTFGCKLLIVNKITALSRFAEPFQNLSNHFKIVGAHALLPDKCLGWSFQLIELDRRGVEMALERLRQKPVLDSVERVAGSEHGSIQQRGLG